MPNIAEKADRVLLHLAKAVPVGGTQFAFATESKGVLASYVGESELPRYSLSRSALAATGYCEDSGELDFLLLDCLTIQSGFLEIKPGRTVPSKITPAGWARIQELQQGRGTGADGFIAMWFGNEVKPASDAIYRAIDLAGYHPVLMNREEHNNRIDDEIIARIRSSRFLVADMTGHRGGVYFEAGFALGLGLPVIWICREDELAGVHFDNRQYNFILWQPDALDELERRLKNRIEATLGHGPLASAASQASA